MKKRLTSAGFTAAGGLTTLADALAAVLSGNAYINVHAQTYANGEIRGQIVP